MERIACACETCKSYCVNIPGWFLLDEVRATAAARGMDVRTLAARELVVDFWADEEHPVFLLRPATAADVPGEVAPMVPPRAPCVYLTAGGACEVHGTKPLECAVAWHGEPPEVSVREMIRDAWDTDAGRALVREALGREPVQPEATLADLLGMLARG